MEKLCSTHFRIRGKDCYIDLEKFLESIERKFNIDLSKAPKCNDAIRRVFETALQQQRLIHKKDQRERDLINKLLIEFYRPSPFQLTEHLVRTSQKWERIKTNLKSKQYDALVSFGTSETTIDEETNIFDKNTAREENSLSTLLNVPPNTEVSRQEIQNEPEEISEKEEEENVEDHLPPKIVTNIYKFISPLTSNECIKLIKKEKSVINPNEVVIEKIYTDMLIKSEPKQIRIDTTHEGKRIFKFSLVNITAKWLFVRWDSVSNTSNFKKHNIEPRVAIRLPPGKGIPFRFVYKLMKDKVQFESDVIFKTSKTILENDVKYFKIHVIADYEIYKPIVVPRILSIRPTYSWYVSEKNIDPDYIYLINDDHYWYHLHIYKRKIISTLMLDERLDDGSNISSSFTTNVTTTSDIRSVIIESVNELSNNKHLSPSNEEAVHEEREIHSIIASILKDVIERVLDSFMFDKIYLFLKPHTKIKIPIHFTKAERIGKHQCCYDFEFYEAISNELMVTRQLLIMTEILPNPIQLDPILLDMSCTPNVHGFHRSYFTISNSQRKYPVTVQVSIPPEVKDLIRIVPSKTFLPVLSTVKCSVELCSKPYSIDGLNEQNFVYITIEIAVDVSKSIGIFIPKIYYEIVTPNAIDYEKLNPYPMSDNEQ